MGFKIALIFYSNIPCCDFTAGCFFILQYDEFFDSESNFIWDNPNLQAEAKALFQKYVEIERAENE